MAHSIGKSRPASNHGEARRPNTEVRRNRKLSGSSYSQQTELTTNGHQLTRIPDLMTARPGLFYRRSRRPRSRGGSWRRVLGVPENHNPEFEYRTPKEIRMTNQKR